LARGAGRGWADHEDIAAGKAEEAMLVLRASRESEARPALEAIRDPLVLLALRVMAVRLGPWVVPVLLV